MLSPNYFSIFFIPIKNSLKIADIMIILYIGRIFEQINKTATQIHFVFSLYKHI